MELTEELRTWDAIPSDDTEERTGALKYLRELCDRAADEIERLANCLNKANASTEMPGDKARWEATCKMMLTPNAK